MASLIRRGPAPTLEKASPPRRMSAQQRVDAAQRNSAAIQGLAPLPSAPKEPLHTKYRPKTLDDVVGQDGTVANLKKIFESKRVPHAFLFTGNSGCGKTTLARIIGIMLGCDAHGIIEVDAARYSTLEMMRSLLDGSQYASMGNSTRKVIVIDEAHGLSTASWRSLLLSVEQPPEHLYWVFCTTEPSKVPVTIRTRCHAYDMKPVKWDLLAEYLAYIVQAEGLSVDASFIDLAARQSQGSVRQALVYVSMLDGITNKDDAIRLMNDVEESGEGPITLARLLVSGRGVTWASVQAILATLTEVNPETIRIVIITYTAASLIKQKTETEAMRLCAILQAFSVPCNPLDKMAPILLAVGGLVLQGDQQ